MKTGALARCCAALMPLLLMACAAANSVHYAWPGPGESRVISVDAKLRNTIVVKDDEGKYRFCSEDGPAAMSAGSFSIAALLGLSPGQRDVSLAQGAGETVASIEHTQTVNLLHKALYRTCELWASGALDQREFYALAARTHRSMVAVLAVEQMTGVVRPKSTIISGPAVSAAVSQSQELVKLLQGYKDERTAAKSALDAATKTHADANVDVTTGGATKKACELTSEPTETETKAAYNKCVSTKAARDQADVEYKAADKRENSVLNQLAALSAGIGAAIETGETEEGGLDYNGQKISDVKMALIAQSVEKIALTAGIDEALMFCMTYLRQAPGLIGDSTRAACNQVVILRARQDAKTTAEISGAADADHREIIDLANDPLVTAEAEVTEARYQVFRINLATALERTTEQQWAERWKAFAEATRTGTPECASLTACRRFVAQAGAMPLYGEFTDRQAEFAGAVTTWLAALDAAERAKDQQGERR